MFFQLQDLNQSTMALLPDCCRKCGWWQGKDDGWSDDGQFLSWSRDTEEVFGSWGKLALADERLLGFIQFGPAEVFPRAGKISCGPVDPEAVLLTCSMIVDDFMVPARKSLVVAALSELQQRGVEIVEAFCQQDEDDETPAHFLKQSLLRDCGFYPVRTSGGLQLMKLELGGAIRAKPLRQKPHRRILDKIKRPAAAPSPAALCRSLKNGAARARSCS